MENAMGSAFNDLIFGDSANNILEGGFGSDYLVGGQAVIRCPLRVQHRLFRLSWGL